MSRIDLNCDLGEGAVHDAELMPLITSANIACGIHAGDVDTMRAAVRLARRHNVAIGAHPSLNDRANFGRLEMPVSPREVHLFVLTQTKLLKIIARQCRARVVHVKPHGALYNLTARDRLLAEAVANAVFEVDPMLVLFGLAGSELTKAGRARGLQVVHEVFADRTYQANGLLTPRSHPEALINDAEVAVTQVMRLVREGRVRAVDGTEVSLVADTVCLHSDGAHPVEFARRLNTALRSEGVAIKAFGA